MLTEAEKEYYKEVRKRAKELKSDGCSRPATQLYQDCCYEHDVHYRTGKTLDNKELTRKEADKIFMQCMRKRSLFGIFSPIALIRFLAVRLGAKRCWRGK